MGLPQLHGYKINSELAAGGMAQIYDAIQVSLNRPVAIKFLDKQLLSHIEANELFERESLIIAQLNHPNIVQVIDKGISDESQPYFVMEKIRGLDLSQILTDGELPFGKKLDIAIQICKGLAYAHKNGVIHRDIKPSNVIIDQHGNVKILDFGIALAQGEKPPHQDQTSVLGTQGYVAPEQREDYGNATIASDIYSVGILLLDLFAGPTKELTKKDSTRFTSDIDPELKSLILKCCDDSVSKRYHSLTQVRDELLAISQGSHLGKTSVKEVEQENKDLAQNFNLLDVLSKTNNKQVYLFQKKSNRQLLVIKRTFGEFSGFKEAKYLSSLKHPNIVNIFAAVKNNNNATVISEYLSGGSLNNQLIQDLDEQTFLLQACQICSALYFAHQNNILHSNLSPNNILIDAKQNLKLCDFGQAHKCNDDPEAARAYQPPGQQAFSEAYDIYCMGAIFHHMLFGVPPGHPLPSPPRKVSFRLEKLIDNMLALDPINRPSTAQQVLVELQRIANSANKKLRSQMGQASEEEKAKAGHHKKSKQTNSGGNSVLLWVVLLLSLALNVFLIVKEFLSK